MDGLTLWTMVGGLAGAAGVAVPFAHRFMYKPIAAGVVGLKTMHANVVTMKSDLAKVEATLKPNGGTSLFDQVGELRKQQLRNGQTIAETIALVRDTNLSLKRTNARTEQVLDLIERPLFEASLDGHLTRANNAFVNQIGVPHAQLLGLGWVSLVMMEQRSGVMREVSEATQFRRMFRIPVVFETEVKAPSGVLLKRRMSAMLVGRPIVDGQEVLGYQGELEAIMVKESPAA